TVDLRRRSLQDRNSQTLRETEEIDRAVHADLGRLHGVVLVVNRRRRASQVVDLVDLDVERKGHVVAHDLEVGVAEQMRDVALRAGIEVVHANDFVAVREQPVAQVGTDESGPSGNQNPRLAVYVHESRTLLQYEF